MQRTALDFLIHTCMTKDKYMVHPTKYALGLGFVLFSCGLVLINITHILRYHFTSHYNAWRHNDRNGVSNHQPHDCLLNNLFRGRSTKTSKLRVTGLCSGNSPVTGEFPAQKAITWKMFPFDDDIMHNGNFQRASDVKQPRASINQTRRRTGIKIYIIGLKRSEESLRKDLTSLMWHF